MAEIHCQDGSIFPISLKTDSDIRRLEEILAPPTAQVIHVTRAEYDMLSVDKACETIPSGVAQFYLEFCGVPFFLHVPPPPEVVADAVEELVGLARRHAPSDQPVYREVGHNRVYRRQASGAGAPARG